MCVDVCTCVGEKIQQELISKKKKKKLQHIPTGIIVTLRLFDLSVDRNMVWANFFYAPIAGQTLYIF